MVYVNCTKQSLWQLVKKSPHYGTWKGRYCFHKSRPYPEHRLVQSTSFHPTALRCILIISSNPSSFYRKTLYTHQLSSPQSSSWFNHVCWTLNCLPHGEEGSMAFWVHRALTNDWGQNYVTVLVLLLFHILMWIGFNCGWSRLLHFNAICLSIQLWPVTLTVHHEEHNRPCSGGRRLYLTISVCPSVACSCHFTEYQFIKWAFSYAGCDQLLAQHDERAH
jgi:hypothetical protein